MADTFSVSAKKELKEFLRTEFMKYEHQVENNAIDPISANVLYKQLMKKWNSMYPDTVAIIKIDMDVDSRFYTFHDFEMEIEQISGSRAENGRTKGKNDQMDTEMWGIEEMIQSMRINGASKPESKTRASPALDEASSGGRKRESSPDTDFEMDEVAIPKRPSLHNIM